MISNQITVTQKTLLKSLLIITGSVGISQNPLQKTVRTFWIIGELSLIQI